MLLRSLKTIQACSGFLNDWTQEPQPLLNHARQTYRHDSISQSHGPNHPSSPILPPSKFSFSTLAKGGLHMVWCCTLRPAALSFASLYATTNSIACLLNLERLPSGCLTINRFPAFQISQATAPKRISVRRVDTVCNALFGLY